MQERLLSDNPDDVVLYRVERGVAVITLNQPDRLNAWTPNLSGAMSAVCAWPPSPLRYGSSS